MKDERGLYYHPDPSGMQTRMYVRQGTTGVEFRLWRADYPEVWEKHGWLAYDVISAAASMYKQQGNTSDPLTLYDINVATALLKEEMRKTARN